MTTIRDTINGEYSSAALDRLLFPIAWSGTTSADELAAEEGALQELVDEARESLASDPDAVAVQITGGKVIATVHSDDESANARLERLVDDGRKAVRS